MLHGWGRLGVPGCEQRSENLEAVVDGAVLTRGLGRSYGDASLPPAGVEVVAGSSLADRVLELDLFGGRLRAEAGLSLVTLNQLSLPRGWFVPVSPGTQFVTLGGMVAADIHGKNHHRARSLGEHVDGFRLRTAGGEIVTCSRETEGELFRATLGGMGLTGHLLDVTLAMEAVPSRWIDRESVRTDTLEGSIASLLELGSRWPYTVAWLDGLARGGRSGRGIVEGGGWCSAESAPRRRPPPRRTVRVPLPAPEWLLSPMSMGLYNGWRWRRHGRRPRREIVDPMEFFYPLDRLLSWNLLYGRRGLTQYQCVLPRKCGPGGVRRFLDHLKVHGGRPFLIVLKDFGDEGEGLLSFPKPGLTLAIDFPVGAETSRLVDTLNELVIALEGRIYLAKDAFTRREHFESMEGERLERFRAVRERWDPDRRIRSRQSERLGL